VKIYRPVALIVLDGWGLSERRQGNAVALARTPVFDGLLARYPHGRLATSGHDVGLPAGQMGNSEVGHLNLGAGFVVDQDLRRILGAVESGAFARNEVLLSAARHAVGHGSTLHLMGLIGDGGVHAHAQHLTALIDLARAEGVPRLSVHAFTDGRDTAPRSATGFMHRLETDLAKAGPGRVASVSGRYYAMDRDRRWERSAMAWEAILGRSERRAATGLAAIEGAYAEGLGDEFVPPTVVASAAGPAAGALGPRDAVVVFNFRADRVRQLLAMLTAPAFDAFPRDLPPGLHVCTMTEVERGQPAPIAFPPLDVEWPLARVLAERGLRQYHTAETEKYAHVTYFFNGGREAPFPGEDRHLVPSPNVATYDLAPEMSAHAVTDALVERVRSRRDDFLIVNYANPDMVGHTGDLAAAVRAVETVDTCLGRVLEALDAVGGVALVTSDHGNAEQLIDPADGGPFTAHTLGPVPIVLVGEDFAGAPDGPLRDGRLSDVAPTVLKLLGVPAPAAMTGRSVLPEPRQADR